MALPTIPHVLPNSLAHRVAAHMLRNSDTVLNVAEISEKYEVPIGDVESQLSHATRHQVLKLAYRMIKGVANIAEYSAGPELIALAGQRKAATWPGHPRPTSKVATEGKGVRTRTPRLPAIDVSTLVVETGVGFAQPNRKGQSRWDEVFDLLTEPDMSTSMAKGYKSALKKAAAIYEQSHPGRKFSVGMCPKNGENCRLLRRS
ncbi:hypothetical protein [Roseateles sp.]|uniref:hypothetical protein n=1 Tax=Roseateles sp. TaxID=1971397 RepID=UPI002F3E7B49